MLFNSSAFLFVFLPAFLACYLAALSFGRVPATITIIVGSCAFYLYGDREHFFVLALSFGVNYWLGRAIVCYEAKYLLAAGIAFNLAVLGYFKYRVFLVNVVEGDLFATPAALALPLAISFLTFHQITFLVDACRRQISSIDPLTYVGYIAFFPHFIAGPIVRYADLVPQLDDLSRRSLTTNIFAQGVALFCIGLFKKVAVADSLGMIANPIFEAVDGGNLVGAAQGWLGLTAYTLQIYFDFSGYSEMAIGLGLMCGLRLPINFLSPYQATSFQDFWRRWHISLSTFLRDYLYIPLGGNRAGWVRTQTNLMVTMLLGGLWHGASINFVIWGALHGAFLAVERFVREMTQLPQTMLTSILSRTVTLLGVMVAWSFFRSASFDGAIRLLRSCFLGRHGPEISIPSVTGLFPLLTNISWARPTVLEAGLFIAAVAGFVLFAPNALALIHYVAAPVTKKTRNRLKILHPLGALIVSIALFVSIVVVLQPSAPPSFIYFRF
jgi:alginate O-acetyltransferase complex protein AlgI